MERLPVELFYPILRCATEDAVRTNREWVVQLALVSHFVHELVSPILYHTMVVTRRNYLTIASLADLGDKTAHIFRAVRCLIADVRLAYPEEDRLGRLFPFVTSIEASQRLIQLIASNPESRLRRLVVRYGRILQLPASTLASVTHITEPIPNLSYVVGVDYLAERLGKLLQAMPALTHVALEMFSVRDRAGGWVDLPQELVSLQNALRVTLRCPRVRAVAVRVANSYLPHYPAILDAMAQFKDARLFAWRDKRPIKSWERADQLAAADAMARRTIWTKARPVWQPDA